MTNWDPKCTWEVIGYANGPYGMCRGKAIIKAPDPDTALEIAEKNHAMFDFEQVKHVSGRTGRINN